MIEICSNCKREITKSEQACVFNSEIVCSECDAKLRSDPKFTDSQTQLESKSLTPHVAEPQAVGYCFFCGAVSNDNSAAIVPVHQALATFDKGSDAKRTAWIAAFGGILGSLAGGFDQQVLFRKRQIKVPRCASCKETHDSISAHYSSYRTVGGVCGTLAGLILAILSIVFGVGVRDLGDVIAALLLFVIGGLLIGILVGHIIAKVTSSPLPESVKPEKDADNYPEVKRMHEYGWDVRILPHTDGVAQYFEIGSEAEEKIGITDVLDRARAQEMCASFLAKDAEQVNECLDDEENLN